MVCPSRPYPLPPPPSPAWSSLYGGGGCGEGGLGLVPSNMIRTGAVVGIPGNADAKSFLFERTTVSCIFKGRISLETFIHSWMIQW